MRVHLTTNAARRQAAIKNRGDLLGESLRRTVHDDIELAGIAPEQQVARGAADQLDVVARGGEIEQLRTPGQLAQALQQRRTLVAHLAHARPRDAGRPQPIRTGMPAAARCDLASAIVCRP